MQPARTTARTSCPSAPAALAAVANLHRLPVRAEEIAPLLGLRAIAGLGDLVFAARLLGFESTPIEASYDDLYELDQPNILALQGPDGLCFAVLRAVDVAGAWVQNPVTGEVRRVSRRELTLRWTGDCLLLAPDQEKLAAVRERLAAHRRPRISRFAPGPTAKVLVFAGLLGLPAFAALASAALDPHGPSSAVEVSSRR